jgi:hypothetical protein
VIYFQGKPIWLMQYQGWCKDDDPEVIALLKAALTHAYEQRKFFGGRGQGEFYPYDAQRRALQYLNRRDEEHPIEEGSFDRFEGEECIRDIPHHGGGGATQVFYHRYQGMLLIPTV